VVARFYRSGAASKFEKAEQDAIEATWDPRAGEEPKKKKIKSDKNKPEESSASESEGSSSSQSK
jgi:hypothetical protein